MDRSGYRKKDDYVLVFQVDSIPLGNSTQTEKWQHLPDVRESQERFRAGSHDALASLRCRADESTVRQKRIGQGRCGKGVVQRCGKSVVDMP